MADYADLLASLNIKQNALSDDAGEVLQDFLKHFLRDFVTALNQERSECAAAIRALIAERDAAVLAEREACAKVCDNAEFVCRQTESRFKTYNTEAEACNGCATTIRARSND